MDSYGDRWFICGVNPLVIFGWGNVDINDCTVTDSYFNCLNIINTQIYGCTLTNYSLIFDFTIRNSYIESLKLSNESTMFSGEFIGCEIYRIHLNNSSEFSGSFINSYMNDINIDNDSYLYIGNFNNSGLNDINFSNSSYMEINGAGVTISNISYINLTNGSYISSGSSFAMDGESQYSYIDLSNSSYINIDNFNLSNSSEFTYINMSNNSRIYGNMTMDNGYLKKVDISNRSSISGTNDFINGGMRYIREDSNSEISDIYLNNSCFKNIICDLEGYIGAIALYDSNINTIDIKDAGFYAIGMTNSSHANSLSINSSSFGSITFDNSNISQSSFFASSFYSNTFVGSQFSKFTLNNSSFESTTNNGTYLTQFDLKGSRIANLSSYNLSSNIIDLSGHELTFNGYGTVSSFPEASEFKNNVAKYQFNFTFDGSDGYGLSGSNLNLSLMPIADGFYIERIIIDSNTLTYDVGASFSFGIYGVSPSSVTLLVSEMDNILSYIDLSNDRLLLTKKSGSDGYLTSRVFGGDVTGGNISVEVTLKKTNYSYNYDY